MYEFEATLTHQVIFFYFDNYILIFMFIYSFKSEHSFLVVKKLHLIIVEVSACNKVYEKQVVHNLDNIKIAINNT